MLQSDDKRRHLNTKPQHLIQWRIVARYPKIKVLKKYFREWFQRVISKSDYFVLLFFNDVSLNFWVYFTRKLYATTTNYPYKQIILQLRYKLSSKSLSRFIFYIIFI